jgi:hypothetical protein
VTALTGEQIAELHRLESAVVGINRQIAESAGVTDSLGMARLTAAHEHWSRALKSAAPVLLRTAAERDELATKQGWAEQQIALLPKTQRLADALLCEVAEMGDTTEETTAHAERIVRERDDLVAFLREHGAAIREGLVNADDLPDGPGNASDTPWGKRLDAFDDLLERFGKP